MLDSAEWVLACAARELMLFATVGLVVGGLDDLAVDLFWLGRSGWRALTVYRRHDRATVRTLGAPAAPGHLAVFVPAWQEAAVIGPMLRAALGRFDHPDYAIYVGTYPNDPATRAAARAVADPRIRLVEGRAPGPTTKAECLNRCWQALLRDEAVAGRRAKAVVLHDAEDVVHPGELRLYDRLIERFDLVQIPVVPLPSTRGWFARAVSLTYADEFAEAHGKQLAVREAVGAGVPSAGVGTALARDLLGRIAGPSGQPFDDGSLTEDYELGLRIKAIGGRAAFVSLPAVPGGPPVAVHAHFPDTIDAAVRQKARWMTGIALAGWDRLRWHGGLTERWMRLRDRRTMLAAIVLAAAYAAALLSLLCLAFRIPLGWPAALRPLQAVTLGLLGWRLFMRFVMVGRCHGWREGLAALPRVLLSNLIEMAAARRAMAAYVPGRAPRWDKTVHHFPEVLPCD